MQSVRELRSKGWRSPDYQSEGTGIRTLSPLRRFRQGPSYSPNRLVSQSATLKEWSVQDCKRAKHKTFSPLEDRWVILTSSKAFDYFRAWRDEIRFAFYPPLFVDKITVQDRVSNSFRYTFLKRYCTKFGQKEIWLSPVTKAPTPTEKSKKQRDNIQERHKNFDDTMIADRLRTVSWSNSSHPTGVVKPVYERSTFQLTATAV